MTLYQSTISGSGISGPVSIPTILNDISSQFDGTKTVFNLLQDQTAVNTIVDSKDLEVVINGLQVPPYITQYTYPWLTPYDSFKGFRVINLPNDTTGATNVGKLIIYNPRFTVPSISSQLGTASLILRQASSSVQKSRYPFTATTIALGD